MRIFNKSMDGKVEALLVNLDSLGLIQRLSDETCRNIVSLGFRGDNLTLAGAMVAIVLQNQPLTLRSVFYQVVSAGLKPSTDGKHYKAVGNVLKRLRRAGIVEHRWIVDSMRSTVKPSSWANITDYVETVQDCYRKNYWRDLPDYVHVICEKDAIAGVLQPVTGRYDVALSPLRGYASDSFVYSIAETWNSIGKPIHVAYFGDFDASGMDIENDCKRRLLELCSNQFTWVRLGVYADQIKQFSLLPLAPKPSDKRYERFVREHGVHCAEVDAIPAKELRRMVEAFITQFIPDGEWDRLQHIERIERESFAQAIQPLMNGGG